MKIKTILPFVTTAILLASTTATQAAGYAYSGRAIVVKTSTSGIAVNIGDTGNLPSSGGSIVKDVSSLDLGLPVGIPLPVTPLTISEIIGDTLHAETSGAAGVTTSRAKLKRVNLPIAGLQNLAASSVSAIAGASCNTNGAVKLGGASNISNLILNGQPVTIKGTTNEVILNQSLLLVTVKVVANETTKVKTAINSGSIAVNGLHITVKDNLLGLISEDIVLGSVKAGITCK